DISYRELLMRKNGDENYSYLVLHFEKLARIQIENNRYTTTNVKITIEYIDRELSDKPYGKFFAKYKFDRPASYGKDYVVCDIKGKGHLIGSNFGMAEPPSTDFGFLEGDERIYVDGQTKPSLAGTGTEDYFNGGYYFDQQAFYLPLHGAPVKDYNNARIFIY
ncbi:MAG: DUF2961 domain-containing protein, partial [Candidatus Pacearchaeota archaeon]